MASPKPAPYPHRSEVNKALPVEEPAPDDNPELGKDEPEDPEGEDED